MTEVKTIKRGELARHGYVPPGGSRGHSLRKTSDNDADLEYAPGQFFAETSAESANEITVDELYEVGDIRRFSPAGDGVTDDTTAFTNLAASGAVVAKLENKTYVIESQVSFSSDIEIQGNGARIIGNGSFAFDGSVTHSVTSLANSASRGDTTITVNDASGLAENDLIRLHSDTDFGWAPFTASMRKGEMHRIRDISGNEVTLTSRIEMFHSPTTTQVDLMAPIVVDVRDLTIETNDTATNQPIRLRRVADSTFSNVRAYGGEHQGWSIEECWTVNLTNCEGVCIAPAAGLQYGCSLADSQNVLIQGGFYYGTRHGITMGTSGEMPCIHCIVRDAEISNRAGNSGAADFHASVLNSAYINNRIHGRTHLAGRDNKFEGNIITANANNNVLQYLNPNGGVLGYYNNIVKLTSDFSFAQVIGDANATTSALQNISTELQFIGNTIECNSSMSRVAFHVLNMAAGVNLTLIHRNNRLTGVLSGLTRYMALTVQGSADAPAEIEIKGITGDFDPRSLPLMDGSTAAAENSRIHFQTRFGTFTPTYSTDGDDFADITYNAETSAEWRRIDDLVYVEGLLTTDAVSAGSASGAVVLGGLPFTVAQTRGGMTIGTAVNWVADRNPSELLPRVSATQAFLRYRTSAAGESTVMDPADLDTGVNANRLRFAGWYITRDNF